MKNLLNALIIVATSLGALYLAYQNLTGQAFNLFFCLWLAVWLLTLCLSIKVSDVQKRRTSAQVKQTVVTSKQLPLYGSQAGYEWRDVRRSS